VTIVKNKIELTKAVTPKTSDNPDKITCNPAIKPAMARNKVRNPKG
jgi:hypothetical protein